MNKDRESDPTCFLGLFENPYLCVVRSQDSVGYFFKSWVGHAALEARSLRGSLHAQRERNDIWKKFLDVARRSMPPG